METEGVDFKGALELLADRFKVALELEAPAGDWSVLGTELAARKLSLHADGRRGTSRCITS